MSLGYSRAGVADGEAELVPGALAADGDCASSRGELERVGDEVGEHLKHPLVVEVGQEGALDGLELEGDPLLRRGVRERFDGLGEQRDRVAARGLESELAGVDAHDIDQIPDEPVHAGGVALNALHPVDGSPALVGFGGLVREQRRVRGRCRSAGCADRG